MENKKCYKCPNLLTDDNKVKGRNVCKDCNKIICHENYVKFVQPSILAKIEAKSKVPKKCNYCPTILNDENKVKGRNQCKSCQYRLRKEHDMKRFSENSGIFDGIKTCSKCPKILTIENCTKHNLICKECYNKSCNEYKKNNKEKVSKNHKEYYEANKEKHAKYYKKHYKDNKDTYMKNNAKWRNENREQIKEKENERLRNNPIARLIRNCRFRIWSMLKKNKNKHTCEFLECDKNFLKKWLEYNFTEEMTFDNYGTYWHVDHVIPCSRFDLSKEEDINNCFRWTNLQPLRGDINISKQDKIDNVEIISHYMKVDMFAEENNIELTEINYEQYLVNDENELIL